MKKIKTLTLFTFAFFGIAVIQNVNAQTAIISSNSSISDEEILKGFDEKAYIEKLKKEGIPESEFSACIGGGRVTYLMNQRGLKGQISFNSKSMLTGPCVNAGFEDTTFANWTGGSGTCLNYPVPTVWTAGFLSNGNNAPVTDPLARHTIITNSTGFDPIAIDAGTGLPGIPLTAPGGGGVSVRLGQSYVTGSTNPPPETERLTYPITVTPGNTSFTYKYAVVLQTPTAASHTANQQPRFTIQVYDQFGVAISGPCGTYNVEGIAATSDTNYRPFNQPAGLTSGGGFFRPWTTVNIDLTPYIGTTVTIEFVTQDCTLGGHFGYAYIDCSCSQLQATTAFCPNDSVLMLVAPPGFISYQWYDGNGVLIPAGQGGVNDTLWIPNPTLGQVYSVSMFSASGCGTSLTVTLSTSTMSLAHGTLNGTCMGLNNGLGYVTTSGANPPLTYVWHYGAPGGPVVGTNNDSIISVPPGNYYVYVTSGGGCSSWDTLTIANPTNPIDTIFHVSTFVCPNDSVVTLNAPAGHPTYTWVDQNGTPIPANQGGNSSTIIIHNPLPGQVYYCSLECPHWFADSLVLNSITVPPPLSIDATCYGASDGSASVNVTGPAPGPYFYTWTNSLGNIVGSTANLTNVPAGTYTINVHTYGNCASTQQVTINQPFNPNDSIQLVTTFCQEDKNIVMRAQPGLGTYAWYYGNDTSAAGPVLSTADTLLIADPVVGTIYTLIIHPVVGCDYIITSTLQYSPPPDMPNYIVSANVFTPDGNGVNDKFDVSIDPASSRSTTVGNVTTVTYNEFAYVKDFHIEIYNRWGKKVFESSDVHSQWDGKINGNAADEGVYYWMASFTSLCTPEGEPHESTGFVHVLRKN